MRAKRGSIAADVRKTYEAALEDRLFNLPALRHAKCIAVYYPTGSEARFVSNREKLFLFDQRPVIAFPLVRSETNMSFFAFDMNDDWSVLETPREIVTELDSSRTFRRKTSISYSCQASPSTSTAIGWARAADTTTVSSPI